ncbi:hypothetical protein FLL37_27115 [Salmonella enterica]|nr:hypothetical protein [Salmonella enterica]
MTAGTVKKSPVIVVKKKRQFTLSPAPVTENVAATPAPAFDAEKITAPVAETPALKASADAGKKINISERRAVAAEFFASRQDDRKNRASNQRRALMSRKMSEIRAQEKSDFHWKPARPRR